MKQRVTETKLDSLIPDDLNANKGTKEGQKVIEKSLRELGAGRSILLDRNNRIIAGNKTVENASLVGLDNVIIVETTGDKIVAVKRMDIDLDSKIGRELAIVDNASSELNLKWDEVNLKMLKEAWDIMPQEWGVEGISFEEFNQLEDDDYEIPDKIKTDIVYGDFFRIGDHRLLCGDSTLLETYKKLFMGEFADLVVTDPPYNVDYTGGTQESLKIMNDNMSDEKFYQFLFEFYKALAAHTKKGAAWYVWHADTQGDTFRKAMKNAGVMVKQCLVWVKSSMVMGRQDYQWKHEPCLYGWTEGASHNWYSDRKQTTVLEFDKPSRNADHPTMKPVPLISYQIQNSSKASDIVADAFAGSGTTMVAAHQLNRRAFTVELDPKYCQVIIDRMKNLDPGVKVEKISGFMTGKVYA